MRTGLRRGFCLFSLSLAVAVAQPPGPANRDITLDVVVTDKSGTPQTGLTQQDFTLLDNKQPQKILSFQAMQGGAATAELPIEVVLVLDQVNAGFRGRSEESVQLQKFLNANGGELARPVSLVFFSDAGTQMADTPSRDGKALAALLQKDNPGLRTINRSQGFYGANDRLGVSLRGLQDLAEYEATKPGRKLVVWISPGWPLLSGPNVQLSTKNQQQFFASVVGLSDLLRRARITLYNVDPLGTSDAGSFRTFYYQSFVKGVKNANQVQLGNLALQVLATQSGGRVLNGSNDVAGEVATCVADANAFYVLSFEPRPADGPNDYHALELKVDKPHFTALTRTGYYAQP